MKLGIRNEELNAECKMQNAELKGKLRFRTIVVANSK